MKTDSKAQNDRIHGGRGGGGRGREEGKDVVSESGDRKGRHAGGGRCRLKKEAC